MLGYLQGVLVLVPKEEISLLVFDVCELLISILSKRKDGKGIEGKIINSLSVNESVASIIWDNIYILSRQKQSPKVTLRYTKICEGIEFITTLPASVLTDIGTIATTLKGKWSLPQINLFIAKTFISATDRKRTSQFESNVSAFFQGFSKFCIDNPTVENIDVFIRFMEIVNDKDFSTVQQKLISILNKNYSKFSGEVYFKYAGQLFDAAAGRGDISSEVFKLFFKAWYDKKGLLCPPYSENPLNVVNISPKIFSCSPKDYTLFWTPILKQGPKYPDFQTLLHTIYFITTQTKENLRGLTQALSPPVTEILSQDDLPQEQIQMCAPLMSILWQNESSMHGIITTFMSRLVKNNDITVLRHASSFFSDIMENYPVGTMPMSLITTFATQFLKRTDAENANQQIVSSFALYRSFFKSLLLYIEKNENVIDEEQWQRVSRATESKLITFAFLPSKEVKKVVQDIWDMCRSPVALELSKNRSLAATLPNITTATLIEMKRAFGPELFEQRFLNIALFFNTADARTPEFRSALAQFIYVMMKPSYFSSNESLVSQVVPKILRILGTLSSQELLQLAVLQSIETWPMVITELVCIQGMHVRNKVKIAWSISCNRHFAAEVRKNAKLRKDMSWLIIHFLKVKSPTNEAEQSCDTNGAEFSASFIRSDPADIIKMKEFVDPYSQVDMIIRKLNPDSITLPDISHVFAMIELAHTYVDTWPLPDAMLENVIDWTLYIALKTKGSALLQLKCHELLHSAISKNMSSLAVIIKCCFRASVHTTAHLAAAIASSDVSANDLAILALGLCGRPNIICRAIAAEIANKSANGHFSPLEYLEPNFEDSINEHYASVLSPQDKVYVFSRIPEVVGTSANVPSALPHLSFISERLSTFNSMESIERLYRLTAITDFSDLSPVQPLLKVWDHIFKSPPVPLNDILEMLIGKVTALTNAKELTATCLAFSRAFLAASKPTSQFLLSKLQIIKNTKLTFDGFLPTTEELVASAAISYIFTLETDSQRFNVCWMGQIHFLLTWAIFLRFNPLYEYYQLPPLLMSSMHAAVPSSDLPLFVMPPSQCVANAVLLPFRHSTEFTTSQMELLIATLRKFTMLTADLFIDECAYKAPSLTKYSPDFWLLFANFFQPRHSSAFLNIFMESAQAGDLTTVGLMLPILTGVVKQKAPAQHVGGFIVVIIFVISTTHDLGFLNQIVQHLPGFVEAVLTSADSSTISSTLGWVVGENGGEQAIVEGVLDAFVAAKGTLHKEYSNAITFLVQIARLLAPANTKFSLTSAVLFAFDGIRRIQSGGKYPMNSQNLLEIEPTNTYEELAELLKKHWPESCVSYITSYVSQWAASSAMSGVALTLDILEFISSITNAWTQVKYISSVSGFCASIAHSIIASNDEKSGELSKKLTTIITEIAKSEEDLPDLIKLFAPLVGGTERAQKKADPATIPSLLPKKEKETTLVEVCQFIKTNILE